MVRRAAAPAIALCAIAIVAIAAAACGSSASTNTEPVATAATDTAAAPTASDGPQEDGLRPEGRSGLPDGPGGAVGLGRGTRFVPLDNPEIVSADAATFLEPQDRVLGLNVGGESRAYPISMMTFHHVANDELGGLPVLVTF